MDSAGAPKKLPMGPSASALLSLTGICTVPVTACVCDGIFDSVNVMLCDPCISPSSIFEKGEPCPVPKGALALRSGRPKVVWPFPP